MSRNRMNYGLLNCYVERVFIARNNMPMMTKTIRDLVKNLGLKNVKTRNIRYLLEESVFRTNYCKAEVIGKRPLYQLETIMFLQMKAIQGAK